VGEFDANPGGDSCRTARVADAHGVMAPTRSHVRDGRGAEYNVANLAMTNFTADGRTGAVCLSQPASTRAALCRIDNRAPSKSSNHAVL